MGSCCAEDGPRATILGLGKAFPEHVYKHMSYPDYYFEITNSNHMVDLKAKFATICERTGIEKRHMYMSDEWLRSNPSATAYKSTSLNLRQEVADEGVPRLGAEAARNAIKDWGKQACGITHLVFTTSSSGCLPGADCVLIDLLGLPPSTKRVMLYQSGCHGGCSALRVSKDIAENNPNARVLVVSSEVMALQLRGPSKSHMSNLIGQAIFGDAAGAAVVGCFPTDEERPLFQLVWASQELVPGTSTAIVSKIREEGIVFDVHRDMPLHVSNAVGTVVQRALVRAAAAARPDLNEDVFWVVHAGGRAILDAVENKLGLRDGKLAASREVMRHYGNTRSSCVFLVMEEMRLRSKHGDLCTAGEGLRWGLLLGFGPGVTMESILLQALPISSPV